MNKIENIVYRLGRLRQLWNGKGVNAPLNDPLSWTSPALWGAALGRKPATKEEAVEQYTSWTYVCAKLNAMTCASVPLELYAASEEKGKQYKTITTRRIDKSRAKDIRARKHLRPYIRKSEEVEEVTDHAFLELMQNVNPFMNATDLMELTVLDMDLTGEAYWYILKGKLGQPEQLWPVPSIYMRPVPGKTLKDFIAGYRYQRGSVEVMFKTDEIVAFAYPNPANQLQGFSCLKGVVDAVYVNNKMHEYEETLFANKARTGGVLEAEAAISQAEMERLRAELDAKYSGNANAGRMLLLSPGLKYVQDTMTNEEMSFIEGRRLTREEVSAGFDVPIGLLDPNAIRANVEGAQYYHAKYGIAPRLRKIEEKLNEKLLPMFDDSGVLFCAFEDPVPEDREFQLAERAQNISSSVLAINEARADMGLDPVDGGDVPLVPFNLVPLGSPAPVPGPAVPEGDGGEEGGEEPETEAPEDELAEDAEKLADLTLLKLRERLGIK